MNGFNFQLQPQPTSRTTFGSAIMPTVVLLAFIGGGGWTAFQVARQFLRQDAERSWTSTPCTIISSRVDEKKIPYVCQVAYSYEIGGRRRRGTVIYPTYSGSDDYYNAAKLHERFAKGTRVTCLVNPADATQAVLVTPSPWTGLTVLFPLLFVLSGAGGLYLLWRPRRPARSGEVKHPLTIAGGFFAVFLVLGLGILAAMIPQVARAAAAQKWPQVSCVIASSSVGSREVQDKHGSHTVYFVRVLFHYRMDGRRYGSSRFQFFSSSSGSESSKQAIVNSLPRGLKTVCFVNPSDPDDAVLNRQYAGAAIASIGIPSIVALIGAAGLLTVLRMARQRHLERLGRHLATATKGPVELKSSSLPGSQCGSLIFMALMWNGIVAISICAIAANGEYRTLPPFVLAIMGLFVVAGLWLAWKAINLVRLFLGVKVHLGMDPFPVAPGETAKVQWHISGRSELIRDLTIRLRSFNGKNLPLAMAVRGNSLSEVDLFDSAQTAEIQGGQCTFELPADAEGGGDVVWAIEVEENYGRGTSIKQEFPIQVERVAAGEGVTA